MNRNGIKTGILSGSFNPVHTGHLILAEYLCEYEELDEIWFVVSPQNPLKHPDSLIDDRHRVEMVRLAIADNPKFACNEIELTLPRPSYTIDTLDVLKKRYPEREFRLIIGADNWLLFDRWKEHRRILSEFDLLVYPRAGSPVDADRLPDRVRLTKAPMIEISSTFIRAGIEQGKKMNYFLPADVRRYIREHRLYHR